MFRKKTVGVLIAAAGKGSRMGMETPKQFHMVNGVPMVAATAGIFERLDEVDRIWIVTGKDQKDTCREIFDRYPCGKLAGIVEGGVRRQDSVRNGIEKTDTDLVLVHDGARVFVTPEIIRAVIEKAEDTGAAVCGVPLKDTVRDGEMTLDREKLTAVQTPQGFDRKLLEEAFGKAYEEGFLGTDEASIVERTGAKIHIVPGSYDNIKITTKEDMPMEIRTGTGYDVHRLVEGRDLILGGVKIEYDYGLLGHSDADVMIHAVMDALLGAAALGDIGKHFPDSNNDYKGISSVELLKKVRKLIEDQGYAIGNIDVTLIAQRPKIAGYIPHMKKIIADAAGTGEDRINIKATTTEGLGFTGAGDGIAAQAVCILKR